MIRVQFDMSRYVADLEKTAKRAVPYAMRNALNEMAFEARKLWQRQMREKFTLRNKWTEMGVRVIKARGIDPRRMQARVMHPEGYLVVQEVGGYDRGAVPTGFSAGEGQATPPRKKLVRQANKMGAIALGQRYRRGNRRQQNRVAVATAARAGKKFVFLDLGNRKGLFRLGGGRKNPKVSMVWDTSSQTHRVPPTPTLGPAIRELESFSARIITRAVVEQLKRHRVFGY